MLSATAMDPVEKKPLYHFHPGTYSFSVGFYGCNLRCPFCQNYQISTTLPGSVTDFVKSSNIVSEALKLKADSISYTYSEPLIHAEYCLDTAAAATERGLSNILVTNGFMSAPAAETIYSAMDAVNIDLKSFNKDYYSQVLKGGLDEVCRSIEIAVSRCHTEVTTLIVPGENDSRTELIALFGFLSELKPQPVLHLSRYFPRFKYTHPPTEIKALLSTAELAKEVLDYVYVGNLPQQTSTEHKNIYTNDTRCSSCKSVLIRRESYKTDVLNRSNSVCDNCGSPLPYLV